MHVPQPGLKSWVVPHVGPDQVPNEVVQARILLCSIDAPSVVLQTLHSNQHHIARCKSCGIEMEMGELRYS